MSEYIYVHLIDKRAIGTSLKSIPLHMTVLHWFETDQTREVVVSRAKAALNGLKKVTTHATHEDMFGAQRDIPVMRLERNIGLLNLHTALLGAMEDLGASFDRRWTGSNNYSQHVTHKLGGRLAAGEFVVVGDVDVISRDTPNSERVILDRFVLGS